MSPNRTFADARLGPITFRPLGRAEVRELRLAATYPLVDEDHERMAGVPPVERVASREAALFLVSAVTSPTLGDAEMAAAFGDRPEALNDLIAAIRSASWPNGGAA